MTTQQQINLFLSYPSPAKYAKDTTNKKKKSTTELTAPSLNASTRSSQRRLLLTSSASTAKTPMPDAFNNLLSLINTKQLTRESALQFVQEQQAQETNPHLAPVYGNILSLINNTKATSFTEEEQHKLLTTCQDLHTQILKTTQSKQPTPSTTSLELQLISLINQMTAALSKVQDDQSINQTTFMNQLMKATATEQQKQMDEIKQQQEAQEKASNASFWEKVVSCVVGALACVAAVLTAGIASALVIGVIFALQTIPVGSRNALSTAFDEMGIHGNWQILATTILCVLLSGGGAGLTRALESTATAGAEGAAAAGADSSTASLLATTDGLESTLEAAGETEMTEIGSSTEAAAEGSSAISGSTRSLARTFTTLLLESTLSAGVLQQSVMLASEQIGGKNNKLAEILGAVIALVLSIVAAFLVVKLNVSTIESALSKSATVENKAVQLALQVVRNPYILSTLYAMNAIATGSCETVKGVNQLDVADSLTRQGGIQKELSLLQSMMDSLNRGLQQTAKQTSELVKSAESQNYQGFILPGRNIAEALLA